MHSDSLYLDPLRCLFKRAKLMLSVVISAGLLAACASAPVQEMSDARQAIRAAQDAGAANRAAQPLTEAQTALNRAESQLSKRFFRAARRNAEEARSKAVEALQRARGEKAEQP